ncbi:DNA-directed RNA polymerase sigma-70 factor [Prescottella defluvii]|uniref:DNA-directed RNA polymerase sigma-70 factor n=1 Tax=Prescottella defluvii TaxID=1323361 RepID=UPI0004F260AE|nr:DNA-directed RNA polymerase sigma-70 factor [Prescottella defluvii]
MTQARRPRQFGSTEHLASEAIASYVDGELRMNAYLRASQHLALCPECAAEVDAQQQARIALRHAGEVAMPSSLFGVLSQIPRCHVPEPENTPPPASAPGIISFDPNGDIARRWPFRRRR